ncbi:hypothetical protein FZP57_07840 [Methanothermobacter sp. THM-1]|uniref:hypothetical protein n=1 Tax=Methanothermobacter sp. THM-1 TaxID=2606911 RepID=UPI0013675844|nr:hypothetical protein [Methanothermobacter sp. THM-1]QHN06946.1 hypothetical protein FZP57_07840 [Methanothermobacter sp. THM-1]
MEVDVTIQVDDDLYRFLQGEGADLQVLIQVLINQMNYCFREAIGTYGLLKEVDLEEALMRMSIEARAMNEESMRNLEKEKRRKDLMSSRRDVA